MNGEKQPKVTGETSNSAILYSDRFSGLPLRKLEFLCGQGGRVVSVTVQDKSGRLATVDEWGKVLWKMSDDGR